MHATVRLLPRILLVVAALSMLGVSAAAQEPGPSFAPTTPSATPSSTPGSGASTPPEPTASPTDAMAPAHEPIGTWRAIAFDPLGLAVQEPLDRSTLLVSFQPEGKLEGSSACGGYIGGYSVDGEAISLGILTTGTSPCGRRRDDEQFAFTQALQSASTWLTTETGLELRDIDGRTRVWLVPPAQPEILGDWHVLRSAGAGDSLVEPIEGSALTLSFDGDDVRNGSVAGSAGCRLFEGPFEAESDRLVIGLISMVGLPCEGAMRRQERRYRAALESAVFWSVKDGLLVLSLGSGVPVVELVAAVPPTQPGE